MRKSGVLVAMVCFSGRERFTPQSPFSREASGEVMVCRWGACLVAVADLSSPGVVLEQSRGFVRENSRDDRRSEPPGDTERAPILNGDDEPAVARPIG